MYVPQECDPKLSMYSQWKTRPCASDSSTPAGIGPVEAMSLYDSRHHPHACVSVAKSRQAGRMLLTHSSHWTNRKRPTPSAAAPSPPEDAALGPPSQQPAAAAQQQQQQALTSAAQVAELAAHPAAARGEGQRCGGVPAPVVAAGAESGGGEQPKRVRIFAGGFKSNEDYTYVRGRGRGRYVCEECGIRCKKPSMLKKHIRTHTDLRPYTCRQCNFSFKTKGAC